ncbi:hypothetical protein TRFO_26652 [Tritrichomonas foetus]|uniref:Uncharacterized protein n=1 Tax=Tritrichomonas foetus TaxID=1144522 RepID=A0A1J4K308_9EUKA|nr:hypothetical protein TRFO_26652 [Tritrichomonas foetus]|eukprot:OHT05579.1 hypothetical protein TRFO_26652 [Tritrichomonas foetus]
MDDSDQDVADQIYFWQKEFDDLKKSFSQLFSKENELFESQMNEITKNHEYKLEMLEKWRKDSEESIDKDMEVKIEYLKEDCQQKISEIPFFLKQSIQKQFTKLKNEFSDVFDKFTDKDIPFIEEFSKDDKISIYEVDTTNQPFLTVAEMKKDEEKVYAHPSAEFRFDSGRLISGNSVFCVGSDISVRFGKMQPINATISNIFNEKIELMTPGASKSIFITIESLNAHLVKIYLN